MHREKRDKYVSLGENQYNNNNNNNNNNRLDHAPRNIITLLSTTRTILNRINKSPTKAIETDQDDRSDTHPG